MIFAIRDDDTNYFTKPENLIALYERIWDRCPVSLSVVPFHACTQSKAIPEKYWAGDHVFPIGDNGELISFLREMIRSGRVCITLHGYCHKDESAGPEFVAGTDLKRKVAMGKLYLEQLLGIQVRVFVPPHNSLSKQGWRAIIDNGLSISGGLSPRQRGIQLKDLPGIAMRRLSRKLWPTKPVTYRNHVEIPYSSLSPSACLPTLLRQLAYCRGNNSLFCVATHYWELDSPMLISDALTVGAAFRHIWGSILKREDVVFGSLNNVVDHFKR
jgi:hypothetical protein